jgi:hypothetical protein
MTTYLDIAALNDPAVEQAELAQDFPALQLDQWSILDPALLVRRLIAGPLPNLQWDQYAEPRSDTRPGAEECRNSGRAADMNGRMIPHETP